VTPAGTPDEARPTPARRRRGPDQTRTLAARPAAVLRAATEYAVVGTDPQGTITDWSAGAERLLGYRAEAVVDAATPSTRALRARLSRVSAARSATVTGRRGTLWGGAIS
jgi:PAS domain-containing protein